MRDLVEIVDLSCCSGHGDVGLFDDEKSRNYTIIDTTAQGFDDVNSSNNNNDNHHTNDVREVVVKEKKKEKSSKYWPLTGLSTSVPKELSLIPKHRSRPKRTMGTLDCIRQKLKQSEKNVQGNVKQFETKRFI